MALARYLAYLADVKKFSCSETPHLKCLECKPSKSVTAHNCKQPN